MSERLGPLAELPGTWLGQGMRILARAGRRSVRRAHWEIRATDEAITFAAVGPLTMADVGHAALRPATSYGVQYTHAGSDAHTGRPLFSESGIWVYLAPTLGAHGPTLLHLATDSRPGGGIAEGDASVRPEAPDIYETDPRPFDLASGEPLTVQEGRGCAAQALTPREIEDPNTLLRERVGALQVIATTPLNVTAPRERGTEGARRPSGNRRSERLRSTLWIEALAGQGGEPEQPHLLQYSRRLVREHDGVAWPVVSIATLARR